MRKLDKLNIEKLLKSPDKCPWMVIITQFMEYDIPDDCPFQKWVRAWIKKNEDYELDKNSGLI